MSIRLTNTLSGKKEVFQSLSPGAVKMYTCGPTVYGLTHIGNARPPVFFDVVRRFFELRQYKVSWVMNFTDVDDKIINRAREEKTTSEKIAQQYTDAYLADLKSLGVRLPTLQPKVTETIPQIITLIERLIQSGAAYAVDDGEVFFSIKNFPKYGQLSGKKVEDLKVGVRIQPGEKKRDPLDFSLWKPRKAEDEPAWESPWGWGRPGWHIECSAMAMHYLGETFDIHGGGLDLVHPHHENEIAQAEACTHQIFARYWMHNNLISIDKEKMSKSLGNVFLTRDFISKYTAEVLRYLLLSVHYRSPVEFSERHIQEIQAALHRVYTAKKKAQALVGTTANASTETPEEKAFREHGEKFEGAWLEAMDDDFGVPKVLALVFDYVRLFNAYADKKGFRPTAQTAALSRKFGEQLQSLSSILNLFGEAPEGFLTALRASVLAQRGLAVGTIESKLDQRTKARAAKDYKLSDSIRDELLALGIELQDTPSGSQWDVVFKGT